MPEELTIEQLLRTHASIPRNPLIAEVCYKAGYIDSWGRGVEKITNACKESGLPAPLFIEHSGGILVELCRYAYETTNQPGKLQANGSKTTDAILLLLGEQPTLTLAEAADLVGKSVRAVERTARKLNEQGKLRYVGPQKGGHWEIKE